MAIRNVPRNEFFELVENVDKTLYNVFSRVKPHEVDESSIPKFEERVNQCFDEFRNKFPTEDVANTREAAVSGIPGYILSAGEVQRYDRNMLKKLVITFGSFAGGLFSLTGGTGIYTTRSALTNPSLLESILIYGGGAALVMGILGVSYAIATDRGNPLTVYRKKLKNRIIDAYMK